MFWSSEALYYLWIASESSSLLSSHYHGAVNINDPATPHPLPTSITTTRTTPNHTRRYWNPQPLHEQQQQQQWIRMQIINRKEWMGIGLYTRCEFCYQVGRLWGGECHVSTYYLHVWCILLCVRVSLGVCWFRCSDMADNRRKIYHHDVVFSVTNHLIHPFYIHQNALTGVI